MNLLQTINNNLTVLETSFKALQKQEQDLQEALQGVKAELLRLQGGYRQLQVLKQQIEQNGEVEGTTRDEQRDRAMKDVEGVSTQ